MEDDIQKRYPITWAVLRNVSDRITNWKKCYKASKNKKANANC